MKIVKKLIIALAILLVVLVAAAITIPILFKGKLLAIAKTEINKNLDAKVDFADVNLSLFRHFPDLGFRLENFSVKGIDQFEGVTLAKGDGLDLELDLGSLIGGGAIRVESIELSNPEINVLVMENGKANYDIAKSGEANAAEEPSTNSGGSFTMELKSYTINDANIVYDDRSMGVYTEVLGLNHKGSGNLTLDVYDLNTHTDIESLSVVYDDIAYLNKAKTKLDAIFNINQQDSKYTLKENELLVNDLKLNFDGFVQMLKEDILLDFSFNTPQNEFKNLLSLVPNAYIEGYEDVKADGQFALNGMVKGIYRAEPISYPAFDVNMKIENGQVKYPDLPLGVNDIFSSLKISSPSSDFDDLTVDASDFRVKIGSNPFRAKFKLATPMSDPAVDAEVDGVLNLKELTQAFPMGEDIEALSGIITADVKCNTRMSVVERGAYDQVNMSGEMRLRDLIYDSRAYPTVAIQDAAVVFNPRRVQINRFESKLGQSDLSAEGSIDNILAYFSPNKTMTGKMKIRSNYFNADEWVPESNVEPTTETADPAVLGAASAEPAVFDRFQFDLDADVKEIVYGDYRLRNTFAAGSMAPNRLDIRNAGSQIGESDIKANGYISNIFDYIFADGVLGGNLNVVSRRFNLNEFMIESGESAPATASAQTKGAEPAGYGVIPVPDNIQMTVNAEVGEIIYTNMTIEELKGKLLIEDRQVIIEDALANTLGGKMAFSGAYDTRDLEKPAFQIKYDLQNMDFQKSFNTFNTFQRLAPIGQFIKGQFNTSLIMDGTLGKNMLPDFTTLNAQGFLETLNSVVQGFKPLEAIGNALDIRELKDNIEALATKNWFEVKNGMLEIKPFDLKIKDIKMNISGQHSVALTGGMDYNIKAEIPREMLEKSTIGAAANKGLTLLQKQAGSLGINLAQSDIINVGINLTGSIKDPKTNVNLLGVDGKASVADAAEQKAQEEIKKVTDSLQNIADKKIEKGAEVIAETKDKIVDSLKTVADKKIEETKEEIGKKAGDLLKDQAGSVLDSTAQKGLDKLLGKKDTTSTADDIKDKLDKFNPFKKKKKNDGDN